jgi:hypothetical protein
MITERHLIQHTNAFEQSIKCDLCDGLKLTSHPHTTCLLFLCTFNIRKRIIMEILTNRKLNIILDGFKNLILILETFFRIK